MGFLDYDGLTSFWEKVKTVLTGKQDVMYFDNSLNVHNGTVGVATPVKGVTQAEYDALSEEEKNSGLYIVTDANINLNDRGDVYSTEETRIGTWIDGKPLYRICIVGNTPNVLNRYSAVVDLNGLNIDNLIVLSCTIDSSSGTKFPIPFYGLNNDRVAININAEKWLTIGITVDPHKNRPFRAIIEYTKTTDAATKAIPAPLAAMTHDIPGYDFAMGSSASAAIEVDTPKNEEV